MKVAALKAVSQIQLSVGQKQILATFFSLGVFVSSLHYEVWVLAGISFLVGLVMWTEVTKTYISDKVIQKSVSTIPFVVVDGLLAASIFVHEFGFAEHQSSIACIVMVMTFYSNVHFQQRRLVIELLEEMRGGKEEVAEALENG